MRMTYRQGELHASNRFVQRLRLSAGLSSALVRRYEKISQFPQFNKKLFLFQALAQDTFVPTAIH